MMSSVEQLLRAAKYLEMQDRHHQYGGLSPPDSPVATSDNHLIQFNGDVITNTAPSRIDARNEEPFLNEHTVARPLVVIPSQNHQQHLNNNHHHHPTHSLSPQSYDASRSRSSSLSSNPITANCVHHVLTGGEDSSQSSLNLSASSGYLSGSSANSSVGGSNLNLSGIASAAPLSTSSTSSLHVNGSPDHQAPQPQQLTNNRRRTISSNSNGGIQHSPCILRAGTREVHNKLEKNRRAHLKECFEQLRKQLPFNQEEKKASNLSILGNASRTVQSLKRKDRELEHEMERLAKEKVAHQKRILVLKRELSQQFGHDVVLADPELPGTVSLRERFSSESLSEPSLPSSGRARYSSTSSLSSAATATSPCTAGVPTQSAMTISNVITSNVQSPASSPQRPLSSSPTTIPLSLITTTKYSTSSNDSSSSLKITPVVPNGLSNGLTNGITAHHHNGGNHIAINFTTSEGVSPALITATSSAMPINLNGSKAAQISQGLQIITTTNNNNITTNKMLNGKNGMRTTIEHQQIQSQQVSLHNTNGSRSDISKTDASKKSENEPPTKVLKLINGSAILASVVDKDHKLIPAGLQVVSLPVRVIGPSPMATIDLSNSNVPRNHNHLQTANGAQLQKLLVNGTQANITTANTVMTTTTNKITNEFPRLPGGAELNILPTGTNGTNLYRTNGKVAIINNGFNIKEFLNTSDVNQTNGRSVHMVTPVQSNSTPISGLTPIVVSQGQNGTSLAHIIAPSSQLAGKVVTTPLSVNGQGLPMMGTQYLSTAVVKPVVVTVAGSGNTVHNGSITLPITSTSATNSSNL
ncbi:probable GPI-anchored adhesin-like protein PGA18 [Bradysia coprophila]|uniref:probable GPI-anchored adhesin-like protein PGA18 n=1 Tax=Bradysia coprophila TaxID=38358 RepID=UPI00187DAF22|nr:probable GPI-anchored adhesin-like protein PGA18 [Bradysia coprophila]